MSINEQVAEARRLIETGTVRLGMKRSDLKSAIGSPSDVGGGSRKYPTPSVFRYGRIEYHFGPRNTDGLALVFAEDDDRKPITIL